VPRTLLWKLTTLLQTPSKMVRGHPSPRFLRLDALSVSILGHTNEVVIGPRGSGFLGTAVALDRPAYKHKYECVSLKI